MIDSKEFLSFVIGVLSGIGGYINGKSLWEHFQPAKSAEQMESMAQELRETSHRMAQLAEVCDRIAQGENPSEMELPDEVRESYNNWRQKR